MASRGKTSRWEDKRPSIHALFEQGKQPAEVIKNFPDISRQTVYRWHEKWLTDNNRTETGQNDTETEQQSLSQIEVITGQKNNLVLFDSDQQESDYKLVRRTLRSLAKPENTGYVRIQAAVGLMKLISMKASLPKAILEETEEISLSDERDRLQSLSPEEIARRYREAL